MPASLPELDVQRALRNREFGRLRELFVDHEPADVAEAIDALEPDDRAVVFRVMPRDLAADTFEYLSPESQEGLIGIMEGTADDFLQTASAFTSRG